MVPKRPHDAYDMNVKNNLYGENIATKEKNPERLKVRRSIMHSVRNTAGKKETLGDKRVVHRPGYDFKTAGGLEGFHEIKSMERLIQG